MIQAQWGAPSRKYILCADAYDNRIFQGRLYTPQGEMLSFGSLAHFMIIMEQQLNGEKAPLSAPDEVDVTFRKGALATFELQVLFRQHTSWQGMLRWREKNEEKSFRSALEMVMLLDNALYK